MSVMVTIITFVTVFSILSFKTHYIIQPTQSMTVMDDDDEIPEGSGYIFDDFNKDVNIKD